MTRSSLARRSTFIVATTTLLIGATPAFGQGSQAEPGQSVEIHNQAAKDEKVFAFDYGVPSSPALTLLGIDKDKVTQSNSLKPFVLSLPNMFSSGEEGDAVALDISLGSALVPASAQTYSKLDAGRGWLFRTRLNIALYEGVSDDDASKEKASRAALGLSTSLLDSSDPVLARFPGESRSIDSAWIRCVNSLRDLAGDEGPPESGEGLGTVSPAYTAGIKTCQKVADLAARIATDLDLGAGLVLDGTPGKLSGFKKTSTVFWGSFRKGLGVDGPSGDGYNAYKDWYEKFGRWFMVGASARVALGELVATGDTATPQVRANTFTGWVGLESYSKTNRFALQVGQQRVRPEGTAFDNFGGTRTVYQASFDQALSSSLWISLSYGKAEGTGALKGDSMARVTISFAAPDARKIFGGP